MRIQIVDLPTQHIGDVMQSPYILVISEMKHEVTPPIVEHFRKDGFDNCAGVIATTEFVQIGEPSAYEIEQSMAREQRERTDALLAEHRLPYGSIIQVAVGGPVIASTLDGRVDIVDYVECPEREEGRGCVCLFGAQDCPVNGRTPRAIGIMDIAPETRAVSVTENEGGTRVAHIAIDADQTPEELGSDVAAIVEEQREYRHIGFCSCRADGPYERTCGIPDHRELALSEDTRADVPNFD